MLEFLIFIVPTILIFNMLYRQIVWLRVVRFYKNIDQVVMLNSCLFDNDELLTRYKEKSFKLVFNKISIDVENYAAAVEFLNEYAKIMLKEYEKIMKSSEKYQLETERQQLEDIVQESKHWLWLNGYIKFDET